MKPTRKLVKPNVGYWTPRRSVWYKKNDDYDVEEQLRKVRLRHGREGTFEEQQAARKEHNIESRRMNKEAREMGYGGGMKQVNKEMKEKGEDD